MFQKMKEQGQEKSSHLRRARKKNAEIFIFAKES